MAYSSYTTARRGGPAMRTQTAAGVLLLLLAILVAAGLQVTRMAG